MVDRCIMCDAPVPEGRQVCPSCEEKIDKECEACKDEDTYVCLRCKNWRFANVKTK